MAMPFTCAWDLNFDTPQLRALECGAPDLKKFYAPNISRLYITTRRGYLASPARLCIPFYKNLRHLHLRDAYVCALCSTITDFPRLETIVIDEIYSLNHVPSARSSSYSATLESMTLPLPSSRRWRQGFIDMFSLLDLPTFRKLTLVGTPKKPHVDCLLSMLAVAPFRVPVVDFQTDAPLRKVCMDHIESLFLVVGEVTFCGNALQIDEYRNSRRKGN
ncbi:hypothetical protein DFJ58DRAFT_338519 [Suillus subalutaceus]|uniref:uncharacterized protein n=1 Tax=Suillus subalutaceus TaxID=48586 RepID=UPI001B87C1B7|nr:uncharacterized protein DFJ58DRAFT_338519 [Suillus subalutaceus]KAG1856683.1 hypothetical protein DFJ58DRAFT_338519 [Suillus subalutaceus]